MLFSMYFGAGNLIFPPILGAQSGEGFSLAIVGFLLTGVALPVVAVIAIARTGSDIFDLSMRGGKIFGVAFPVLVYLAIGAFYALPRTAVVSYSTAIVPLTGWSSGIASTAFFVGFFAVALALAFNPHGLIDKLGKWLTPALLILLVVLVALAAMRLHPTETDAINKYATHPLSTGLIEGYFTMDSLASLAFGILVVSALRHSTKTTGSTLSRLVSIAACGAGLLLGLIYVGLGLVGHLIPNSHSYSNGAELLAAAAEQTMGRTGLIIFGAIVLLACMTTAVGLIGATSEFFNRLLPGVSYRAWAVIFSLVSFAVSTTGLETVLSIAGPIIGFLYPSAITLVLLTLLEPLLPVRLHYGFRFALTVSVVWAALMSLSDIGLSFLEPLISWSPAHAQQLGWVAPTLVLAAVGFAVDMVRKKETTEAEAETSAADESAEASV